METVLGAATVFGWFAIVIWGIANLLIDAKRTKSWEKVGIATLSAATVSGPLLFVMPEHVLFGVHTIGLGAVLAIVSALVIFAAAAARAKWLG
jgi:hypothetical protein